MFDWLWRTLDRRVSPCGLVRLMFGTAVEFDVIENNPVRPRLHRPEYEPKEKPTLSVEQANGAAFRAVGRGPQVSLSAQPL
jgi:hypothetical protein